MSKSLEQRIEELEKKLAPNEVQAQKKPVSEKDIRYLRQKSEKLLFATFDVVGSNGIND